MLNKVKGGSPDPRALGSAPVNERILSCKPGIQHCAWSIRSEFNITIILYFKIILQKRILINLACLLHPLEGNVICFEGSNMFNPKYKFSFTAVKNLE